MSNNSRKQLPRKPFFEGHKPPRGLHGEIDRHGTEVWYFREGHGPRTRIGLNCRFGSQQFIEEYHRAKYGRPVGAEPTPGTKSLARQDPNSLGWLIERYLSSRHFSAKAANTQRNHRTVLLRVAEKNGAMPYRAFTWHHAKSLRDQIAEKGSDPDKPTPAPAMANGFVSTLRTLFDWAIDEEKLLEVNPCNGLKKVAYERTTNHPWTDAECDAFEAAYPLGTRERLAYELLSGTGQRSSDVVSMGPQHIDRDGMMTIIQQKTGKEVQAQVLPALAEAIAAGPTGKTTFIATDDGEPITVGTFGRWLRGACDKIGIPECTAHGLRHAAATRALASGADMDFLVSVFGFTPQMANTYVQTAKLKGAARRGAHFLERKRPKLRVVA